MAQRYIFECYQSEDDDTNWSEFPITKKVSSELVFDDQTTWCVVLENFLDFLGNVYGYDVRSSVKFKSLQEKIEAMKQKYDIEDDYDEEPSTIDVDDDDELWRKIV